MPTVATPAIEPNTPTNGSIPSTARSNTIVAAVTVCTTDEKAGEWWWSMHAGEPARKQTLSGKDELVAGDHVVERQHAGEQARQQQDVDDVAADPAQGVVGGVQQHVGVTVEGALRDRGDLVGADRHDERPAGHWRRSAPMMSTAA